MRINCLFNQFISILFLIIFVGKIQGGPICQINGPNNSVAEKIKGEIEIHENGPAKSVHVFNDQLEIYFSAKDGGFYFVDTKQEAQKLMHRALIVNEFRVKFGALNLMSSINCKTKKILAGPFSYIPTKSNSKELFFEAEHVGNVFTKNLRKFLYKPMSVIFNVEKCQMHLDPHSVGQTFLCPDGICLQNTIIFLPQDHAEMFVIQGHDFERIMEKSEKNCQWKFLEIEKVHDTTEISPNSDSDGNDADFLEK